MPETTEPFLDKARRLIVDYFNERMDATDVPKFTLKFDETYVVWFCKTLQNWKALVSTTVPDQMYYEVTYDGDKQTAYLDAYKKFENVAIPDGA